MKYTKNGINYNIGRFDTLENILSKINVNKLSMKEWYDLLYEKDHTVPKSTLNILLEKKINDYDTSENVNGFIINGESFWLDKNTRVGLMHLVNCSKDNVQLVLKDKILTIPIDVAKSFLTQLEVYAGKCYLQTQKHLLAINDLHTIEDIINYDYTKGYPEKINFNLWEQ